MSDPYKLQFPRAAAILLPAAVLACGDDEPVAPPSAVVPVEIAATAGPDTLALNDSLVLTARSDSGAVEHVEWLIVERDERSELDTLVYRPPAAGTEFVRAVARLADGRIGTAVRGVVTRRNFAPVVIIVGVNGFDYRRVPLGDSIELAAGYIDPDGDLIARDSVVWTLDGAAGTLHVGDTLRIAVDSVRTYGLWLRVTDPVGSTSTVRFVSLAYDPIVPADWRTMVEGSGGIITATGGGTIVLNSGQKYDGGNALCECPVVGIAPGGTIQWSVPAGSGAPPFAAGSAEIFFVDADGFLRRISAAGIEWELAGAVVGPVMFGDGSLAVPATGPTGSSRILRRVSAQGQVLWETPLGVARVQGAAIASDSTVYVMTSPTVTMSRGVIAVSPAGGLLWEKNLPNASCCDLSPFIPVNDSTVLTFADSVYALRSDGSVRWSRIRDGGRTVVDAVGDAHQISSNALVVYRLDDGSEVLRTPIDSGTSGVSPILTADGAILVASGSLVLALDAATHAERWRHSMAGRVRDMLLTDAGLLVVADAFGAVEGLMLGAGPLASPWPQGYASAQRRGRIQ